MPLPKPTPGLVVRYSYLWREEHLKGQEEGVKDRPCAIIMVVTNENDDQTVTEQPKAAEETKPAETPKVETPKYVDRPAAVNTATETPTNDSVKPVTAPVQKVARRKPRRDWTEARIIGELHRHGIYW